MSTAKTKAKAANVTKPETVPADAIAEPVPTVVVEYSKAPAAEPERTHVSARTDRFSERDAKLRVPLDPTTIRTRIGASGRTLSYIDGFTVIDNANKIFGFGGWFFNLDALDLVENSVGKDKENREFKQVSYTAIGSVTIVETQQTFRDVGFGSGKSYNTLGEAIESATKEAATDCLKRCLRFSGNQFGLSLYDKHAADKKPTQAPPPPPPVAPPPPPVAVTVPEILTEIRSRYRDATKAVQSVIAEMIADVTIENGYARLEEISLSEAVELLKRVKAAK